MFVCICNGHRDGEIRAAAETGLSCPRQIYRRLGKPVRCGRCLDAATRVIEEVHDGKGAGVARETALLGPRPAVTAA